MITLYFSFIFLKISITLIYSLCYWSFVLNAILILQAGSES